MGAAMFYPQFISSRMRTGRLSCFLNADWLSVSPSGMLERDWLTVSGCCDVSTLCVGGRQDGGWFVDISIRQLIGIIAHLLSYSCGFSTSSLVYNKVYLILRGILTISHLVNTLASICNGCYLTREGSTDLAPQAPIGG